jgi:DNA-binding NtrC family response regulator
MDFRTPLFFVWQWLSRRILGASHRCEGSPSTCADADPIHVIGVVGPGSAEASTLLSAASRRYWIVETPDPREDLRGTVRLAGPKILVLDSDLYGSDWRLFCGKLKYGPPETMLLVIGPAGDDIFFEEAMCRGAYAVIPRPLDLAALIRTVETASMIGKSPEIWNQGSYR